jgi:hypothetical protein
MSNNREYPDASKSPSSLALLLITSIVAACGLILYFSSHIDRDSAPEVVATTAASSEDAGARGNSVLEKPEKEPDAEAPHDPTEVSDRKVIATAIPRAIQQTNANAKKITVHGLVLDAVTRAPLRKAGVELETTPNFRTRPGIALTDANGTFSTSVSDSGAWSLRVVLASYAPLEREITIDANALDFDVGELLIHPQRQLTVRLLGPDGRSLNAWCIEHPVLEGREFIIARSDEPLGKRWINAKQESIGRIQPSHRPYASDSVVLTLLSPFPRYVSVCQQSNVLASRALNDDDQHVDLTIPIEEILHSPSSVRLRVVDAASGAPIAQARVGLNPPGTYGIGTHETNEVGVAFFESVTPARYYLTIVAPKHEWVQEEAVVGPESETDLGSFRLGPTTSISGRVFDDHGPVAGVEVFSFPLERIDKTFNTRRAFPSASDASGRFTIQSLGRAKYVLRVESGDWAARSIVVDTSGGDVGDAIVHVSRGTEVKLAFDESFVDSQLTILDADRVPVHEQALDRDRSLTLHLAPGKHSWRIDSEGSASLAREFMVPARSIEVHVGR